MVGVGVAGLSFLREVFVDFAVAVVVLVVADLFFGEDLTHTSGPFAVDTRLLTRLAGSFVAGFLGICVARLGLPGGAFCEEDLGGFGFG